MQKNNWHPTATLSTLRARATMLAKIRAFFHARNVLEVETPLLCQATVTDPHIESIPATLITNSADNKPTYYLQTSPEYAMKRLLCAGYGDIFQICKAFRQGEIGRLHNPEFTLLEWYRLGFDDHQLMDEIDELLQFTLDCKQADKLSYQAAFEKYVGFNPHQMTLLELENAAKQHSLSVESKIEDCDTWLQLFMSEVIEPQLGLNAPIFIYDFPASQAALARKRENAPHIAARFEVYIRGLELANGFYELQDANEQRIRFENNLKVRQHLHLNKPPIDEYFLTALENGLPDCAGVALGIDRLLMLALEKESIKNVLSFDITNA